MDIESAREAATICASVDPAGAIAGNCGSPWSTSPVVWTQSWTKTCWSCSMTGPSTRIIVSRHSPGLRASPFHRSSSPTPPQNPIEPSTVRMRRCVRLPTRSIE